LDERAQRLDSFPVDAEIAPAEARCGANVNQIVLPVAVQFQVVYKTQ
jgi:hypothetical protein